MNLSVNSKSRFFALFGIFLMFFFAHVNLTLSSKEHEKSAQKSSKKQQFIIYG